jgi:preprotein translocase subunit SecB
MLSPGSDTKIYLFCGYTDMRKIPQLLFPYARRILSEVTKDGGFQPIMLEHMDFAILHNQRKSKTDLNKSR